MKLTPLINVIGKSGLFTDGDWVLSADMSEGGTVRLLQLADVGKGCFLDASRKFISEDKLKELNCSLVKEGDILISRMSDPIARACLVPNLKQKAVVAVDISIVRVDPDVADPQFVMRVCNSDFFRREAEKLGRGTTRIRITRKNLEQIGIPLCDLKKQKDISAIVRKAESALEKRRETLRLSDEFLRSAFLDMFGDPASNNNMWPVKRLGEMGSVKIGPFGSLLHKEDYVSNGIPLVNPTHIVNKKICPDFNLSISDQKSEELNPYLLRAGDVILARRGEIGRCGLITKTEDGYLCGTGSLFIRPQKMLNPTFLVYLLSSKSMRRTLENSAVGVTMKNLNEGIVAGLNVMCPDMDVQEKFATLVQKVERLKDKLKQSETELENLFNSLMQRAFRGDII